MDRISEVWRGTCVLLAEERKESEQDKRQGKNQTAKIALHYIINSVTRREMTVFKRVLLSLLTLIKLSKP